jgi:hypothetical protein
MRNLKVFRLYKYCYLPKKKKSGLLGEIAESRAMTMDL